MLAVKKTLRTTVLVCEETAEDSKRRLTQGPIAAKKQIEPQVQPGQPDKLCQFVSKPDTRPALQNTGQRRRKLGIEHTSEDRTEKAPLPSSEDEGDRDGDDSVKMKDIWNRMLTQQALAATIRHKHKNETVGRKVRDLQKLSHR